MRKLASALLVAGLLFVGTDGSECLAFTPRTRAEIVRRALTLMPDGLQRQLKKHARPLFAGSLEGVAGRDATFSALDPGDSDLRLAAAISETASAVGSRRPMGDVARLFGEIAMRTADLSFALNVGKDHAREAEFYSKFSRYVERKLPRISITFDGYADPRLARAEVEAFARSVAARARRDYDAIALSYFPRGRKSLPQDFDDRSVAFAAASLEISLAVTATARAWLYAWNEAHGDLAGTATLPDPCQHPFIEQDAPGQRAQAEASARRLP